MSRGYIFVIATLIVVDIILVTYSHLLIKDEYNLEKRCTKYEKN